MKKYYEKKQILILINQICVIVFLCYQFSYNNMLEIANVFPLTLITIMFIYGAYIVFVNIRENVILLKFSNLIILASWQFLFSLNEDQVFYAISMLLSVVVLYNTVQFLFFFFFQDSFYLYKKEKDWVLQIICLLTLITKFFNDKMFAMLFLLQFILSFICIAFLFVKNRRRIIFILKVEKRHLFKSFFLLFLPFIGYILLFQENPRYLNNLGWYIMILFPLFSIHTIAFKNHKFIKQYFVLKEFRIGLMVFFFFIFITSLGALFKFNIMTYFIVIHTVFWFVLTYFTLLYKDIKRTISNFDKADFEIIPRSPYAQNLMYIAKEEKLKSDFSNYLHDEVLQDLLAIKNMINKSTKEEIRQIIVKTLENLNLSIRAQMQEYHPMLLKNLTLKENYSNLLSMVQKRYGMKNIKVSFKCNEDLFLVEPYPLLVYRILKELATNAFKHSKCSELVVSVKQENNEIELIVKDNGIGLDANELCTGNEHQGLNSIKEQIFLLNGKMTISEGTPSGLNITIFIPMKGDDSYEHFINR